MCQLYTQFAQFPKTTPGQGFNEKNFSELSDNSELRKIFASYASVTGNFFRFCELRPAAAGKIFAYFFRFLNKNIFCDLKYELQNFRKF